MAIFKILTQDVKNRLIHFSQKEREHQSKWISIWTSGLKNAEISGVQNLAIQRSWFFGDRTIMHEITLELLQELKKDSIKPIKIYSIDIANDVIKLFKVYCPNFINAADKFGKTPLDYAVEYDSADAVKVLLKNGADPFISRDIMFGLKGVSTYEYALYKGNFEAARAIFDHMGTKCAACKFDNFKFLERLLSLELLYNKTNILKTVFESFHPTAFKYCINQLNSQSHTLLEYAIGERNSDCVALLLQKGANVNFENPVYSKVTPLHFAVHFKAFDIVKLLLDHNANVNAKDREGQTPLHYACKQGDVDTIDLLKNHGADQDVLDIYGKKPDFYLPKPQKGLMHELYELKAFIEKIANQCLDISQWEADVDAILPDQLDSSDFLYMCDA